MSNGDGKVVKFPIRHAADAADRVDAALPKTLAGTVAEPARPRLALQAIAEKILFALGDERQAPWDEDVARAADYIVEAYGSPEAAALNARRLEEDSDLPGFARAVRVEIERRAARKI